MYYFDFFISEIPSHSPLLYLRPHHSLHTTPFHSSYMYNSPSQYLRIETNLITSYKGMAIAPSSNSSSQGGYLSPQATGGFSQIGARNIGSGGGEGGGQAMSVLLSWHEKVVEVAGLGCVVRVMCDRRTV